MTPFKKVSSLIFLNLVLFVLGLSALVFQSAEVPAVRFNLLFVPHKRIFAAIRQPLSKKIIIQQ